MLHVLTILCLVSGIVLAQGPGTVTSTGSLTFGRRIGYTTTLLQDGRVLVAGGAVTSNPLPDGPAYAAVSPTAELYDPSTGAYTLAAGQMTIWRSGQSATLLPNGRILLAGGWTTTTSSGPTDTTEIFDPAAGTFHASSPMNFAKSCPSAVLLNNGKVLIAGGSEFGEHFGEATAEIYDPALNSFAALGPYASAAIGGNPEPDPLESYNWGWCPTTVLRPDGRVTIIWLSESGGGGYSGEVFDPATNTFTAIPQQFLLPAVPTLQLANGLVLFTGGNDGLVPSTFAALYDPNSGLVTPTGMSKVPLSDEAMVLLPDGTALVDGGGTAEVYDPSRGAFSLTGNDPIWAAAGTLLSDGTVLIVSAFGWGGGPSSLYHPNKLVPAPALFSTSGGAQGTIWNSSSGLLASPQTPATAGDILSMYTTSLIEGGIMPPQVSVGGVLAPVLFFGDAPGYPGYFQVNFQVPAGVSLASPVPVRLTYLGRSSNAVTIAVQ